MRKYRRAIIRAKAEKRGVKASKFVKDYFNGIQERKYGKEQRLINKARGTHKKSTWRNRLTMKG